MLIERKLYKQIKSYLDTKEAIIITGMRRTGKTSILRFIYEKIPSPNKIFLDLENPLNQKYFEEKNYEKIKSTFEFLGLNFSSRPYIFLDEIQLVKTLPKVVKYLNDHYQVKFFLTGSASFYLKNLFTESLVGRKYIFEIFPLDFAEFLIFKGSKITLPPQGSKISQPVFETISALYDEYLNLGGFPEVVLKKGNEAKKKSLEDIFTSYFQAEIVGFGDYRKNEVIRDLLILLMQRVGTKLDIKKISSELGISRITLKEYIAFLEGTYFIKTIKPFSRNRNLEIRKMPKVYICDSGLANSFARIDEGRLFENNIFQNLRIRGEVNYYQRKSGVEIDFILNKEIGIEVKLSPRETDYRKLERISKELSLRNFKIITKNYFSPNLRMKNIEYGFYV